MNALIIINFLTNNFPTCSNLNILESRVVKFFVVNITHILCIISYTIAIPPQLTNVTVTEGDDLNLTCINNNPSGVSQEWLDSEGYLVSTDATYTVENVTRNAAGVYTCVLTGVNNYTEGHNATVEVQCKFTYDINKLC